MTPFQEFGEQKHTRGRGRLAEADGVRWLQQQGYEILDRNVAYRAGEIDVVARDDETLCFVEIKARTSGEFGGALWAVNQRKQRQIASAAALYLAQTGWDGACRFDVLAMDGECGDWRFTLVRDAFQLD